LVTTNQQAIELLLTRSRSIGSTSSVNQKSNNIPSYITRGETHATTILVKSSVLQLVNDLWGYEVEFQQKVVEKIFGNELMKPMLPNFLSNLAETKHDHLLLKVSNLELFTLGKWLHY
jgi:hypothetical protein